jgi:hypothetical protein
LATTGSPQLAAPGKETIKTLLYHALRREDLCKLTVSDFRHARRGVMRWRAPG